MTSSDISCEGRGLFVTHERGVAEPTMVLRDVDLAVHPGEMVSVVRPSGSGKSTLLHTLAGFVPAAGGTVRLLGHDITAASTRAVSAVHRQGVGFVFQSYNLIPSLPLLDNVLLPSRFAGRRPDTAAAVELLERFGLGSLLARRTGDLSGGQQQRAALVRVLHGRPRIVFADEPTGALDTRNGALVLEALRDLTRTGTAVLLVTHDLEAAARADRAVVLRDGQVTDTVLRPTGEHLFARTREGSHV